jgi:hypothetical protein
LLAAGYWPLPIRLPAASNLLVATGLTVFLP